MHTEGHDMGRDTADSSTPGDQFNPESPGYETTDVNSSGIAIFLAGLFGTVIVFFFFCYGMGIVINNWLVKQDGPATKWTVAANAVPAGKGKNLASNPDIEQQQQDQLGTLAGNLPEPRLDIDDGEQSTADLHAREDLWLENTSLVDGQPGTIRIPIERAMELIAQRGLPVEGQTAGTPDSVAYSAKPEVKAPLTTGFARTGFELTTIEARKQQLDYGKSESAEK